MAETEDDSEENEELERIVLSNSVEVCFKVEEVPRKRIEELIKEADFIAETDKMKGTANNSVMSLLVYDDLLCLGIYNNKNEICVTMQPYFENTFLAIVDLALSLGHPIRIVEKTTERGNLLERLKPRADLDWIIYDSETEVLSEIEGKPCPIEKYLNSMPLRSELYILSQDEDKVKVLHIKVVEEKRHIRKEILGEGLIDDSIENAKSIYSNYPNALVVVEPLLFCSYHKGDQTKSLSCIENIFLEVYADKVAEREGIYDMSMDEYAKREEDEKLEN